MMDRGALYQRLTALSVACISSTALIFFLLSGTSCSFLTVHPEPDHFLLTSSGIALHEVPLAQIGLTCNSLLLDSGLDEMISLSQNFFYLSAGVGGATTLVAWILSICIPPTRLTWLSMAIMGSVTAVLQVPLFLLFESKPCTIDANSQSCFFSMGAYFNAASIIFWVFMTLWAQCISPPNWEMGASEKRRERITIQEIVIHHDTDSSNSNPDNEDWIFNNERKPATEMDVEYALPAYTAVSTNSKRKKKTKRVISPLQEICFDAGDDISGITFQPTKKARIDDGTGSEDELDEILNDPEKISSA
eukprot:scaffold6929_cov99-Cylindrotheca_fusiformis.AAC.6